MVSKSPNKINVSSTTTKLLIKNMVCNRCIKVVGDELRKIGIDVRSITLGEVVVNGVKDQLPITKIKNVMEENGFELIEDKSAKIIEKIKLTILDLVRSDNLQQPLHENYSDIIVEKLGLDYHYLSSLFSSVENITIEQYIILQKIERAKELLKYGELTLSEIAYKLGYSSVQHLSNQFRKVTGMTASQFKNITENIRKPLDKLK
ncbi:MAG: helix-turn-helix transcriptional regulator [Bacteroidetes bacterium]|nr:helix-turn-helix transcriptional regulator [Bacteroidota bacterium]